MDKMKEAIMKEERMKEARMELNFAMLKNARLMVDEMDEELAAMSIENVLKETNDINVRNAILNMKKNNMTYKEIFYKMIDDSEKKMKKNFQ